MTTKHQAKNQSPNSITVARIYMRVSSDDQDLTRQAAIVESTRAAGCYVAGVYREKASGARADRPELLRMIADLQPGEIVVAEKIDRISRLPLAEAELPMTWGQIAGSCPLTLEAVAISRCTVKEGTMLSSWPCATSSKTNTRPNLRLGLATRV